MEFLPLIDLRESLCDFILESKSFHAPYETLFFKLMAFMKMTNNKNFSNLKMFH